MYCRWCQTLDVQRSNYYNWKKGKDKLSKDIAVIEKIKTIFTESKNTYGIARIQAALIDQGVKISYNKVMKLKSENNIYPKMKKRYKNTTQSNHHLPIAENILNREFNPKTKNSCWVSDITYIPFKNNFLYLCTIIDLYSRKVVGYSLDETMTTELLVNSLNNALITRKPDKGLIFNSDRGSQYASNIFRNMLNQKGFIQSMSRKGNCWDMVTERSRSNAVAESFFKTLKSELKDFQQFDSIQQARAEFFEYIEVFYNRKRLHSTLNYSSPYQYERRFS